MNLCVRLSTMGLLCAIACLVMNGCDQAKRGTIVKGKLVVGGAPFSPPLPEIVNSLPKPPPTVANPPDMTQQYRPRLTINSTNHSSGAIVAQDGSFELRGDDGKGVPPGEYTVNITAPPPPGIDPFAGKLAAQNDLKITVPPGAGATITIDPIDVGPFMAAAPTGGSGS